MTRMRTIYLLTCALLIASCGGDAAPEPDAKLLEARARIRTMEDSLFEHQAFDRRSAQGMVDVYKAYAAGYPLDSMAPEYLLRAADMLKSMHEPEQSIAIYDRLIQDYPSWDQMVTVLYMKGLTLDDDLDRDGEAKVVYQQVINNFPEHPFARDAKAMIDNLGLSDEELIAKFKAMNGDSAESVQ